MSFLPVGWFLKCCKGVHRWHLTDNLFHRMGNRETVVRTQDKGKLPQRKETRTVILEIRGPPGRDSCLKKQDSNFRRLRIINQRETGWEVVLIKEGGNRTAHIHMWTPMEQKWRRLFTARYGTRWKLGTEGVRSLLHSLYSNGPQGKDLHHNTNIVKYLCKR